MGGLPVRAGPTVSVVPLRVLTLVACEPSLTASPVAVRSSLGARCTLRVSCSVRLEGVSCLLWDSASWKYAICSFSVALYSGVFLPISMALLVYMSAVDLRNSMTRGSSSPYFSSNATMRLVKSLLNFSNSGSRCPNSMASARIFSDASASLRTLPSLIRLVVFAARLIAGLV